MRKAHGDQTIKPVDYKYAATQHLATITLALFYVLTYVRVHYDHEVEDEDDNSNNDNNNTQQLKALHSMPLLGSKFGINRPSRQTDKALLLNSFCDGYCRARLAAISVPHRSDCFHAFPISACCPHLDNEAVRIAVGLKLWVTLYTFIHV